VAVCLSVPKIGLPFIAHNLNTHTHTQSLLFIQVKWLRRL